MYIYQEFVRECVHTVKDDKATFSPAFNENSLSTERQKKIK
jgi:hypothetical protein